MISIFLLQSINNLHLKKKKKSFYTHLLDNHIKNSSLNLQMDGKQTEKIKGG